MQYFFPTVRPKQHATSKTDYTHAASGLTCFDYHDVTSTGMQAAWMIAQSPAGLATLTIAHGQQFKVMLLAAIGNSWYLPGPPFLYNVTAAELGGWNQVEDYKYLSLLRQLLHGGMNPISDNYYTDLLDTAPCEGPYNFSDPANGLVDYSSFEWSSDNRLFLPENRGMTLPFKGEYNGLDYMLLFNMYALSKGSDYLGSYYELGNRDINYNFPFVVPPYFVVGLQGQTPFYYSAFNTLTSSSIIASNGGGMFKAGREITLKNGFVAENGSEFIAQIEPFDCSNTNWRASIGDSNPNDSAWGLYSMDNMPVEQTMPHYTYSEDQLSKPNSVYNKSSIEIASAKTYIDSSLNLICKPNPFNANGFVSFYLSEQQIVKIILKSAYGQTIRILVNEELASGEHTFTISANELTAGVYLVVLETSKGTFTQRIACVK